VEKNKVKLESKIQSILSEVDKHIEQDKQERTPDALPDMDSCGLREKVSALNKRLSGMNKAEKKQVKKLQEEYLPRLAKYESQLEKLGDRNSFSKTDEDATFMRMKEDHMKNGHTDCYRESVYYQSGDLQESRRHGNPNSFFARFSGDLS